MADVSDPALTEAYNDVRNDKTDTDWYQFRLLPFGTDCCRMVMGYEGKNRIVLQGKGSGGLTAFVSNLQDDQCQYGYVRLVAGDTESKRAKFVLFSWCGPNVSILKKAGMSVHKASVKELCRDFGVEIHGDDREDFNEARVMDQVIKSMGANYMGQESKQGFLAA